MESVVRDITDKNVRLDVYEKALAFLKQDKDKYFLSPDTAGLCLLLPCVWLNLGSFCKNFYDHNGKCFSYKQTVIYFPEFKSYYCGKSYRYSVEYRIEILTEIINQIKNQKS